MLGYLNGISFLGYDFQSYPNSQKISLNILTYPFISYHIPTYPKISSGANSQMAPKGWINEFVHAMTWSWSHCWCSQRSDLKSAPKSAAPPAPPPAARRKCRPCTDMYRHVLPCTLLYFDLYCLVPFRVLPCTFLYCPVPLCTQLSTYAYVLFDIFLYWYVPVCTDLYRFATFLK